VPNPYKLPNSLTAQNRAVAARGKNHRIRRKRLHFHRAQVHRTNTAANAAVVDDGGQECRSFELLDLAFRFVPPHLLVERIQKLLPGRRAAKAVR